jgi:hypothetical protein
MGSAFEHCGVLDPSGLGEIVSGVYPSEDSAGHDQCVDVGRWHQSSSTLPGMGSPSEP